MTKERKITRTIINNTVTVFGADFTEQKFITISKDITGKIDAEKDELSILKAFASKRFAPQKIESVSTKTERRAMNEEDFISNSFEITDETKVTERLVTRTIISNKVTVWGADFLTESFHSLVKYIGGKIDEWEDKTEILSSCSSDDFVARRIDEIETSTKRRGMTEEDFIKKSYIINDDENDETEE